MASTVTPLPAPRDARPLLPRAPFSLLRTAIWALVALVTLAVLAQAYHYTEFDPPQVIKGSGGVIDILRRGFPPDTGVLSDSIIAARDTVDIAIIGTLMAMIASFPLSMLAAENITPNRACYYGSRAVIGVLRALPDIILALLFVAAVGLGNFPAVLGLGFHSIGILGRLYAEAIEDMDMGPVEALRMAGASRIQIYTHAVVPGVITNLIGVTLYRMDTNVRSTLALGFVGGGGLGFLINSSLATFEYHKVVMNLIVMLLLVIAVEVVAVMLRRYVR